jgi:hypothetical protein
MTIPADALIPMEKLTRYLLVPRSRNDKSKFLAKAGYIEGTEVALVSAIRGMNARVSASKQQANGYGTFYRVDGTLVGVNSVNVAVTTIWLERKVDGIFQFITLVPGKGAQ